MAGLTEADEISEYLRRARRGEVRNGFAQAMLNADAIGARLTVRIIWRHQKDLAKRFLGEFADLAIA